MKKILLTHKTREISYALIDNEDFNKVNKYKWFECNRYAVAEPKYRKRIWMHRLIMNCPKGMEVDHIDGDGRDNRKKNLRIVSHKQNSQNRLNREYAIYGFRGVSWHKQIKRWRARSGINGKQIHIGTFKTEREANNAYIKFINSETAHLSQALK